MIRIITVLNLILFSVIVNAQKHDYVWRFGFGDDVDNPSDTLWGTSEIDFIPSLSRYQKTHDSYSFMDFNFNCVSVADKKGKYLFSSNGDYIEDASRDTMKNGNIMSSDIYEHAYGQPQGCLVLPFPGSEDKYVLFQLLWKYVNSTISLAGYRLNYYIIDMKENNGLGSVIEKHQLLTDTLDFGKITSVRHANGRDWWILVPVSDNDEYQSILLTPDGVKLQPIQSTHTKHIRGLGQACFSPDGTKYTMFSAIDEAIGTYLYIYDFDRCTGFLSNPRVFHNGIGNPGGIVFASDSKILYGLSFDKMHQFDMEATDIVGSRNHVADRDGYISPIIPPTNVQFRHSFFCGQLGPDGKIYIHSLPNINALTVIEEPDIWGYDCYVNQHSVYLSSPNMSVPNNPNYRLGPVDGSSCDTLGINNIPLARFRYTQEEGLRFRFRDLSDYEPATWNWDFGDGETSGERHPKHEFPGPGVYKVCLTVRNPYGSDTYCEEITLGVIGTTEGIPENIVLKIHPNPSRDYVNIFFGSYYYPLNGIIELQDTYGQILETQKLNRGDNEVSIGGLPSGVYFVRIKDGSIILGIKKVIKQ